MCLGPAPAFAKDYSIVDVDVDATVLADGSLSVTESREFAFDGEFHGVYWRIPKGSYQGREIDTSLLMVGEIQDSVQTLFIQSQSGDEGTFTVTETDDYLEVTLFFEHKNENARFFIEYRCPNLAFRYEDASVLYWKFVSDGWGRESKNVHCVLHLPVPVGESVVASENVQAWGHGPLDAEVSFEGNDVIFDCPGVGVSEFAEMRVLFPSEWLSLAPEIDGNIQTKVLAEEKAWVDSANRDRDQARALMFGIYGAAFGVPLLTVVLSLVCLLRQRKQDQPVFSGKYFRDVPSDDHPAVIDALLHGGHVSDEGLVASLMRLCDEGYVRLESDNTFVNFGSDSDGGYRIVPVKGATSAVVSDSVDRVDDATMVFLFEELAPKAARISEHADASDSLLYFGDISRVADKSPERYDVSLCDWKRSVNEECKKRGFFSSPRKGFQMGAFIAAAVDFTLAFFSIIVFAVLGVSGVIVALCISLGMLSCVVCIFIASKMKPMSDEAIDIVAKANALKRWLKDFTRLEEAVPQDVILWDKLLVMAVVLGVSDEVIEQLKVAVPHVLDSAELGSARSLCRGGALSSPMRSFDSAMSNAHHVSASALASTSHSSSHGGGGGFSGGGGGGFGGGGGGGAF